MYENGYYRSLPQYDMTYFNRNFGKYDLHVSIERGFAKLFNLLFWPFVSHAWDYQFVRDSSIFLRKAYHILSSYLWKDYIQNFTYLNLIFVTASFLYGRSFITFLNECPGDLLFNNILHREVYEHKKNYLFLDLPKDLDSDIIEINENDRDIVLNDTINNHFDVYKDINYMSPKDFYRLSYSMAGDYLFLNLFNIHRLITTPKRFFSFCAEYTLSPLGKGLEVISNKYQSDSHVGKFFKYYIDILAVGLRGPWLEPNQLYVVKKYSLYRKLLDRFMDTWNVDRLVHVRIDNPDLRFNDIGSDKFDKILSMRYLLFNNIVLENLESPKLRRGLEGMVADKNDDNPFEAYRNLMRSSNDPFRLFYKQPKKANLNPNLGLNLESDNIGKIPGEDMLLSIKALVESGLDFHPEFKAFMNNCREEEHRLNNMRGSMVGRYDFNNMDANDIYEPIEESEEQRNIPGLSNQLKGIDNKADVTISYLSEIRDMLCDNASKISLNLNEKDQENFQRGIGAIVQVGRFINDFNRNKEILFNTNVTDLAINTGIYLGTSLIRGCKNKFSRFVTNTAHYYAEYGTEPSGMLDSFANMETSKAEEPDDNVSIASITDKEHTDKEHTDKEHTDKEHTDKEHTDNEITNTKTNRFASILDPRKSIPEYACHVNPMNYLGSRTSIGYKNSAFCSNQYDQLGYNDRSKIIDPDEVLRLAKEVIPKYIFASLLRQLLYPQTLLKMIEVLNITNTNKEFDIEVVIHHVVIGIVKDLILIRCKEFQSLFTQEKKIQRHISDLISKGKFREFSLDSRYRINKNGFVIFEDSFNDLLSYDTVIAKELNKSFFDAEMGKEIRWERIKYLLSTIDTILNPDGKFNLKDIQNNLTIMDYFKVLFMGTEDKGLTFEWGWNVEFDNLKRVMDGYLTGHITVERKLESLCLTLGGTYRMILEIMREHLTEESNGFGKVESDLERIILSVNSLNINPDNFKDNNTIVSLDNRDNDDNNGDTNIDNTDSIDEEDLYSEGFVERENSMGSRDELVFYKGRRDVDFSNNGLESRESNKENKGIINFSNELLANLPIKSYMHSIMSDISKDYDMFRDACRFSKELNLVRIGKYVHANRYNLSRIFEGQWIPDYRLKFDINSMILKINRMDQMNMQDDGLLNNYIKAIESIDTDKDFLTRMTMVQVSLNVLSKEKDILNSQFFQPCRRLNAIESQDDSQVFQLSMALLASSKAMITSLHYHLFSKMEILKKLTGICKNHRVLYDQVCFGMIEATQDLYNDPYDDLGELFLNNINKDDQELPDDSLSLKVLKDLVSNTNGYDSMDSHSILYMMNGLMNRGESAVHSDIRISDQDFMKGFIPGGHVQNGYEYEANNQLHLNINDDNGY